MISFIDFLNAVKNYVFNVSYENFANDMYNVNDSIKLSHKYYTDKYTLLTTDFLNYWAGLDENNRDKFTKIILKYID